MLWVATSLRKSSNGIVAGNKTAGINAHATAGRGLGAPRLIHATSATKNTGTTWKRFRSSIRCAPGCEAYTETTIAKTATNDDAASDERAEPQVVIARPVGDETGEQEQRSERQDSDDDVDLAEVPEQPVEYLAPVVLERRQTRVGAKSAAKFFALCELG